MLMTRGEDCLRTVVSLKSGAMLVGVVVKPRLVPLLSMETGSPITELIVALITCII